MMAVIASRFAAGGAAAGAAASAISVIWPFPAPVTWSGAGHLGCPIVNPLAPIRWDGGRVAAGSVRITYQRIPKIRTYSSHHASFALRSVLFGT